MRLKRPTKKLAYGGTSVQDAYTGIIGSGVDPNAYNGGLQRPGITTNSWGRSAAGSAGASNAAGVVGGVAALGTGLMDAIETPNAYGNPSTGVSTGKGVLTGAATGAIAGSVVPGIGTAVGAVVGGVVGGVTGFIKGKKMRKQEADAYSKANAGRRKYEAAVSAAMSQDPGLINGYQGADYYANGGPIEKLNRPRVDNTYTKTGNIQKLEAQSGSRLLPVRNGMPNVDLNMVEVKAPLNMSKYGMRAENPKYPKVREIEARDGEEAAHRYLYSTQLGELSDKMAEVTATTAFTAGTLDLPIGKLFRPGAAAERAAGRSAANNRIFETPSLFGKTEGGITANPNYSYRLVAREGLKDAKNSGIVRNAWESGASLKKPNYGADVYWTKGGDQTFFNPNNLGDKRVLLEIPNDAISPNSPALYKNLSNVYENAGGKVQPISGVFKNGGSLAKPSAGIAPSNIVQEDTEGGTSKALSSTAAEFEGNTHAEGGIQLTDVGAEVEDGETTAGNFVFSKKLGFAQIHKPIAKAIGKIEKKPQTQDRIYSLNRLKEREQALALKQEQVKQVMGIE